MTKKITIVVSKLSYGGAESVLIRLIESWKLKGVYVTLITLRDSERLKDLSDYCNIITLNKGYLRGAFEIKKYLMRNSTSLLTTVTYFNVYVGLILLFISKKRRPKWLVRESNLISKLNPQENILKTTLFGKKALKFVYNNIADKIIVQSEQMRLELCKYLKCNKNKIVVIHNPMPKIIHDKFSEVYNLDRNNLNILVISRLHPQKRLDRIPEILKLLKRKVKIDIYGTGPLEAQLKNQFKNLIASDIVEFKGNIGNQEIFRSNYDLMMLTSDFEGFPNVLLESIMNNIPIILFSMNGLIEEILNGIDYPLVIEDYDLMAFAEKIEGFDPESIEIYKMKEFLVAKYNSTHISNQYLSELL